MDTTRAYRSSKLVFFNSAWQILGDRYDIKNTISKITGIHINVFEGAQLRDFSLAQRMSWAASRSTTRVEDIAYCLLGIFDINMPLLYGEGEKAFLRLQEAIMARSSDLSLLAWHNNG